MDPDPFADDEDREAEDNAQLLGGEEECGLWARGISEEDVDPAVQAAKGCPADVIRSWVTTAYLIEGPEELPAES